MPLSDDDCRRIWEYRYAGVRTGDRLIAIDDRTRDLVPVIVASILDAPIQRSGDNGYTTLRAVMGWSDAHIANMQRKIDAISFDGGDPAAFAERVRTAVAAAVAKLRINVSG